MTAFRIRWGNTLRKETYYVYSCIFLAAAAMDTFDIVCLPCPNTKAWHTVKQVPFSLEDSLKLNGNRRWFCLLQNINQVLEKVRAECQTVVKKGHSCLDMCSYTWPKYLCWVWSGFFCFLFFRQIIIALNLFIFNLPYFDPGKVIFDRRRN